MRRIGQKQTQNHAEEGLIKLIFVDTGPLSQKQTQGHIWIGKLDRMCPGLIWPKQTQEQGLNKKTGNHRAHMGKEHSEVGLDKKT